MDIGGLLFNFIWLLATILQVAIIGRSLLSWFPVDPRNPLISILNEVTEPILAPLRRVVPRIGMLDLSPMVAIFVLYVIQQMAGGL